MLNHDLPARADELAAQFQRRKPFRHVVIENFFEDATAESLLRDFPPFERGNARNEAGELAGKSTVEKIRELGASYATLDDTVQSREFLDLVGRITGIPELRYDPWYFGGGTHENRAGQDLDPHIDFNKHPVEPWHRRLNLIVYLNREWHDDWGGCLELHSDPRAADDRVTPITPLFNRAVIFETTEWSWHGFSRIELPIEQQALTRKSIALYFYTTDRPAEELADTHSTVYVDRPLPERFHHGHTLSSDDVQELQVLLARRDQHNQRLYRDLTTLTKRLEQTQAALHTGTIGRLRYFARRVLAALRRNTPHAMEGHDINARIVNALRPLVRRLPPTWRVRLRRWWYATQQRRDPECEQPAHAPAVVVAPAVDIAPPVDAGDNDVYARRAQQEVSRFADEVVVHDLPPIFHYWSNTFLRPNLESFGFSYPEDFFARQIERHIARIGRPVRIVSIGAGNCDSEATIARLLRERGAGEFAIECLDITDAMLQRGAALVRAQGLKQHFRFVRADFNQWQPAGHYDVVMANQSLHHVTNLEGLFDSIHHAIGDDGIFVTSDMIGRNGHQRWPEALAIVREFWQELPPEYRYNRQLHRRELTFKDWDCSVEGFEGIRAQDILPLLLERFGFDFFYAYGNLIDPFIDRGFGPHFDPKKQWDREFIDRVHARDEAEILAGNIKPTHLLAVMRRERGVQPVAWRHLTPQFCQRETQ